MGEMAQKSSLLGRTSPSPRRRIALAIAGTFAVLAVVNNVFFVGRPTTLLQQAAPMYVMAPQMAQTAQVQSVAGQPMYYMPVQAVPQQGLAVAPAAVQQPVVYYYVPAQPVMSPMLAANATAGGNAAAADADAFVCTVANIEKKSDDVQTEWDKCKSNP